jgi:hypothetical protein
MNFDDLMAGMMLVIGLWLYYVGRRRSFNRRNASGQEVFPSYAGKLIARAGEAVLTLLALGLSLTGVLFLAFAHPDSWFGFALIPLGWIAFVGTIPFGRR